MNDKNFIWYFADGSYIEGDEAAVFLEHKAVVLKRLSLKITESISRIDEYNRMQKSDDLFDDVLENGEHLTWIQLELEKLLHDVSRVLD